MQSIIMGATGLVGSELLRVLRGDVTALVRRASGIPGERVIDFERIGEIEIPDGAHVYCAIGSTIKKAGSQEAFRHVDFDYPQALAERTAKAGGKFMLVSSVGADAKSNNFYLRVKGELEEAVRTMELRAFHAFRPSFLMGERVEKRPGEKMGIAAARAVGFLLPSKYRAIEAATVARAMAAAGNTDAVGNFIYHYTEIRKLAGA
ncbi:MAG: oxidoreductase [Acidobacteriia bacterium]|nr:oxidoreductase [Terriglobia bacterium]